MNIINKISLVIIAFIMLVGITNAQNTKKMKKKVLFVVTSHNEKGNTGEKTGYYLSEVTHPWEVLFDAGYEIDFVSPLGGKAPVDGFDLTDSVNKKFWENTEYRHKVENTMKPSEVDVKEYAAIFFAGGHGTMWDLPDNKELQNIAAQIYEANGIVGAVCHGPAGLVNIKLKDGSYLVAGKKVNAFTNEEEEIVGLTKVVPFLLEDKLKERGVIFEKSAPWQVHVVVDHRLVTGQNPQSAHAVGEAILEQLEKENTKYMKQSTIIFPEKYTPGTTDNFCSNEIIDNGLTTQEVWKYLVNPFVWTEYYSNSSDVEFLNSNDKELYYGVRFRFKTFGFPIEAQITEFVPPCGNEAARLAWHGWAEGDEATRLDVIHAWLIEDLPGERVRILTQESQIGKPAQELAKTKPNPMINGHQDWLDGLVNYAKSKK